MKFSIVALTASLLVAEGQAVKAEEVSSLHKVNANHPESLAQAKSKVHAQTRVKTDASVAALIGTDSDKTFTTCTESQTTADSYGDSCDWYTRNTGNCDGSWDTSDFSASDCCDCGGGTQSICGSEI